MQPFISQALVATRIADMRREAEVAQSDHGRRRARRSLRGLARAKTAATNGIRALRHA